MTDTIRPGSIGGLEVQTIEDSPGYINQLIYGDPGVGKTVLAGSADSVPEMRNVLFIDIEGGTFSLRERNPGVDVVRANTWSDIQSVYNDLYDGNHDYKTVIIDSLTEAQKFSMYGIMEGVVREDPDRDPDIPSLREWGKNIEQIRKFVRGYRDLPMHTIFTALAVTEKDAKTGNITSYPALSGKLAKEVSGFVDIVTYMYTDTVDGEIERKILTVKTDKFIAKDRSDKLPPVVEQPTMQMIHNLIYG